MSESNTRTIATPCELRGLLVQAMIGVIEGRVSVPQANAVVGLSGEVHKSIRQEWDMRCYVDETVSIARAKVVLLEAPLDGEG